VLGWPLFFSRLDLRILDHLAVLPVTMNRLSAERRAAIIRALCEGNGIRATARLTGANKETVMKVLVEAGEFASAYQDIAHRSLPTTVVQADEIWAFVGAKQRRAVRPGDGDIWTFTAIDADTKLIMSWLVGPRIVDNAVAFMKDLRSRVTQRIQLTTDGHNMYETAVRAAFRWDEVHWAMLVKQYGTTEPELMDAAHRYSPPVCTGALKMRRIGRPDPDLVSTSYVERSNLTLRMQQRRFTRLTNAFSKKAENHAHAVSLFFLYYNYCRPHQTLTQNMGVKTTPAMATGLTDRVWTVDDILALMDPKRLLR
jgi:IS1 family transposase